MKVLLIAGARPNFMKIAPMVRAINKHNSMSGTEPVDQLIVHTGQHYDYEMSRIFFQDLGLPEPDIHLAVGSGTHAEQTGRAMIELEKVFFETAPDLVLVAGDVNSTLAGALAAVKLQIPVGHIEAGLRSFDRHMPEEINRLLTDAVSDYLFTPSLDADKNLINEGISSNKIFLVGNIMIDSLLFNISKADNRTALSELGLDKDGYGLLTLHRPENVDSEKSMREIISALSEISRNTPIVFPCHPRTAKNIERFELNHRFSVREGLTNICGNGNRINIIPPLGYLDFLQLMMNSRFILTDSGGIQEESTALNIPCFTLRDSTERPVTITEGTNTLVGIDAGKIVTEVNKVMEGKVKNGKIPDLWDGRTAERILEIIINQHIYTSIYNPEDVEQL